jgi:prevent-host-death family protein
MTRYPSSAPAAIRVEEEALTPWPLQDAKARFSEVVRLASQVGPQRVTVHGRPAVVIVDAAEFDRLRGARTGQALIDVLQASPHADIDLLPARGDAMPVSTPVSL